MERHRGAAQDERTEARYRRLLTGPSGTAHTRQGLRRMLQRGPHPHRRAAQSQFAVCTHRSSGSPNVCVAAQLQGHETRSQRSLCHGACSLFEHVLRVLQGLRVGAQTRRHIPRREARDRVRYPCQMWAVGRLWVTRHRASVHCRVPRLCSSTTLSNHHAAPAQDAARSHPRCCIRSPSCRPTSASHQRSGVAAAAECPPSPPPAP